MARKIELNTLKVSSFITGDKTLGGCVSNIVACPATVWYTCEMPDCPLTRECETQQQSLCCQSAPDMC